MNIRNRDRDRDENRQRVEIEIEPSPLPSLSLSPFSIFFPCLHSLSSVSVSKLYLFPVYL
jgi:hypothetical protein